MDWQRAWGFDFSLYRPVFAEAGARALPVYGLNISNELRRQVSAKGVNGLTRKEREQLPAAVALPLPEQREKLAAFFLRHSAMLKGGATPPPSEAPVLPVAVRGTRNGRPAAVVLPVSLNSPLERFLFIQSLWDSTMAEEARNIRAKAGPGRPLFILAGGGHVEHGYGIAYRLRLLEPEARILLIMPWPGEMPEAGAADIFFHSSGPPAAPGFGIVFDRRGGELFIKAVLPDSRAEKAGLKPGDRIARAGGQPLRGAADLHRAAQEARRRKAPLELVVERDGKEVAATLR